MEKRKPTEKELAGLRALAEKVRDSEVKIAVCEGDVPTSILDAANLGLIDIALGQVETLLQDMAEWIREYRRLTGLGCEINLREEAGFLNIPPMSAPIEVTPPGQRCCQ